jgi:hypothetical protein
VKKNSAATDVLAQGFENAVKLREGKRLSVLDGQVDVVDVPGLPFDRNLR